MRFFAFLLFITFNSYSQTKEISLLETNQYDAGQELLTAQKHHFASLGLTIVGGGIMSIGLIDNKKSVQVVGGACILTGTILSITSWIHIGRAGKTLMREKENPLSIGMRPNGLLLSYRF